MISTTSTRLLLLAAAAVALAAGMAIFGPGGARTPDAGGTESEPAGGAVAADPAPEPQPAAGQEPPSVPPDGAPNSAAGPASSAAPARTALTAGESGIRAANFAALLDSYDSLAARALEDFNARYAGAIAFRTAAEFRWLADNGFPLPDEILAAERLSLEELEALAESGGEKARFLYLDRVLQRIRQLRQSYRNSGLSSEALSDDADYTQLLLRATSARLSLTGSRSPFAGYLMAGYSEAALQNPHGILAGLYYANELGDSRAYHRMKSHMRSHGISDDAVEAMSAYAVIVRGRRPRGESPAGP